MLRVPAELVSKAVSADAGELAELLQHAARLEHATIPPYLTAAYSLKLGVNNPIRDTLKMIAIEEMVHMAIVGNLINAIGSRPRFDSADFLPTYPAALPLSIGDDLIVGLRSFSIELVRDVFMVIEEPEQPLEFPVFKPASTTSPAPAKAGGIRGKPALSAEASREGRTRTRGRPPVTASTAASANRAQFQRRPSNGCASAADSRAASRAGQSGRRVTTPAG